MYFPCTTFAVRMNEAAEQQKKNNKKMGEEKTRNEFESYYKMFPHVLRTSTRKNECRAMVTQ